MTHEWTSDDSLTDQQVLEQVIGFYRNRLQQHAPALEYLQHRGLTHPELIDHFRLGFADRELARGLPGKRLKGGAEARGRLERLGILNKTGHGRYNGSLVVPIFGPDGQIVNLYGRKITARLRKGTPLHLYLPDDPEAGCRCRGDQRGVLNAEAFDSATDELIVCDSILNGLTIWCAGARNVTAVYGVDDPLGEHLQTLQTHSIGRVLIAFRHTAAGEAAAERLKDALEDAGIENHRIRFPAGLDANDYARQAGPDALAELIRAAGRTAKPTVERQPAASPSLPEPVSLSNGDAAPDEQPSSDVDIQIDDGQITFTRGNRTYRVRGLEKNTSPMQLKVNILATRDDLVHQDTLDLVKARSRTSFIRATAAELYVDEQTVKKDVGQLLLQLEQLRQERIEAAKKPRDTVPEMTEVEHTEAMELLHDPNLPKRITRDLAICGLAGEENNNLIGYVGAVSRMLKEPLALLIQSSSSAGKTCLMDAILAMVPPEHQVRYTGMTGQSLFYVDTDSLKHKTLAISEEEGMVQASYALKILQSEGELRHACVGKNANGRLGTEEHYVEGPAQIFLTTTSSQIDEELANRFLVLTVDESRAQTRAIHERQRLAETAEGKRAARAAMSIRKVHQNAQRLLRPLEVYNPYAPRLTFANDKTRLRRDHQKYLTLISAVALLHQYQRPVLIDESDGQATEYINVTPQDIAIANGLAIEVLGRTLDELSPQTRRFLILLHQFVTERCQEVSVLAADFRFTRRDIREFLGWTDFQVRTHLAKLVGMEYVLVHRGRRGRQFVYELAYDGQGQEGEPFLMGLIDPAELSRYDAKFEHEKGQFEPSLSPQRAPIEPSSSMPKTGASRVVA